MNAATQGAYEKSMFNWSIEPRHQRTPHLQKVADEWGDMVLVFTEIQVGCNAI